MKSIPELRADFERMAKSSHFDIDRLDNGEYKATGRNTFILWAGYWECAKQNGVIPTDSTINEMLESNT